MIIYDSFLDANTCLSRERLDKKMEQLSLARSEALTKAYISKAMRLYVMVKHLQETLKFLDVQNESSPIRTDIDSLGYKIQELEGEIEYISIVCMGLTDIFALFINHAFSLGIKPTRVYFSNISNHFPKAPHQEKLLEAIKMQISSIICTEEYKYISSMNNYTKHNNVICASLVHRRKPVYFEARIKAFTHSESTYPEITVSDFIEKIRTVQNSLADIFFTIMRA